MELGEIGSKQRVTRWHLVTNAPYFIHSPKNKNKMKKLSILLIMAAIMLASCASYKNAPGCGSYSHWESKHKFHNR